jgi:hypothetical protein
VNLSNPYMKFLAMVVATAVAIRLAWLLIQPELPELAVAGVAAASWRLWRWHRDRW